MLHKTPPKEMMDRLSKNGRDVVGVYDEGFRVDTIGRVMSPHCKEGETKYRILPDVDYPKFTWGDSKGKIAVHRLAAYQKFGYWALLPGVHVRHLNSNPRDNSLDNIAIGSQSENEMDKPREVRERTARKGGKARSRLRKFYPYEFHVEVRKFFYDHDQDIPLTVKTYRLYSQALLFQILFTHKRLADFCIFGNSLPT